MWSRLASPKGFLLVPSAGARALRRALRSGARLRSPERGGASVGSKRSALRDALIRYH
jgi:hypothetical protein